MAIIKGTSGADTVTGGSTLDDQISTSNGSDFVQASAGDDSYNLGFASSADYWRYGFNDTDVLDYRVAWFGEGLIEPEGMKIVVDLEAGTIQKVATSNGKVFSTDSVVGVDTIWGTVAADSIKGRNFWDGEEFRGYSGNDTLNGRGNEDTASYVYATTAGITVDMAAGTVSSSDPLINNDTLREIEIVLGSNFADTYKASGYSGSSVNRNSFGLDWNVFTGGAGNDTITGNGQTALSFGSVGGAIEIDLGGQSSQGTKSNIVVDYTDDPLSSSAGPGDVRASGVNSVIAGSYNDTLTGGGKVNSQGFASAYTVSGDVSFEQFRGGGGDDAINGKSGFDQADYRVKNTQSNLATEGIVVKLAAGTVTGDVVVTGSDTLRGIESVRSTFLDDRFDARGFTLKNAASPSVNSGDCIVFVPGSESLASTAFNEFVVIAGHDSVTGNGATRISFDSVFIETLAGVSMVATFSSATQGHAEFGLTDGGFGSVDFSGTFSIRGGFGNDQITGAAGFQLLQGGYGNDTLVGGDGADLLQGYNGGSAAALNLTTLYSDNDSLNGGAGNDGLRGDFGADVLLGGAGKDTLEGGTGQDNLTGGSGPDKFRFAGPLTTGHADLITDFSLVDDALQLENAVFTKLGTTGALSSANFRASSSGTANDGNDYVVYDTDSGKLYYDADGSGSGAALLLATLSGAPALSAGDIFVT